MYKTITLFLLTLLFSAGVFAQSIEVESTQYSLVTKKTATWCSICGNAAWDAFRTMIDENNEKAIPLAAHFSPSSDLYSVTAQEIIDNYETSFGQPVFFFNTARVSGTSSAVAKIKDSVDVAFSQMPTAQSGLEVTYQPDSNLLKARTLTQFFQPASGTFHANVYLVEKTVIANQASRSPEAEHKQVLRQGMQAETFGVELGSGDFVAGDTLTAEFVLEMESLDGILANDFELVVILWQKGEEGFDFVNANRTETVTEEEEEIISSTSVVPKNIGFDVPTLVQQQAVIEVEATEFLLQVRLQLYDLQGRRVATIYQGNMPFGKSQFMLDTSKLSADGLYILQLQTATGILNRKLVVQR